MKTHLVRLLALMLCFCALLTLAACGEGEEQKDINPPATDDTKEPSAEDITPDAPEVPSEPDAPAEPNEPVVPSETNTPAEPDIPDEPESPEQPDEPESYEGLEPWKVAYLELLDSDSERNGSARCDYSLVFVDSDNIPELFRSGPDSATGEIICSYRNNQLFRQQLRRTGGSKYIPSGSLVYNSQGNMGSYSTNVYRLTDNGFVTLFDGGEENDIIQTLDTNGKKITTSITLYYIENKSVTEEEFNAEVAKHFDFSKSKSFFRDGAVVDVDYATICQQIKDWDYSILPPEAPVIPDTPIEPETPDEPDTPATPSDIPTSPSDIPTSPSDIVTPPATPDTPSEPTKPDDPVILAGGVPQAVYDAIDEGDFEKAYSILYNIENPSEKQKEFMSHFVFFPKDYFRWYVREGLHIYKFDEQGNIVSDKVYYLEGEVEEYYYNKDGTLQTVTYYTSYGTWDDFTYIYNKKGQAVQCIFETDSGSKTIIDYTYDNAGNLICQETSYEKRSYTYDDMGNLLSEIRQDKKTGEITLSHTYTYDNEGRLLIKQTGSRKYTYTYDKNGNMLTSTSYYNSGEMDYQTSYFYNEKGQRVKTETSYSNGSTASTTYERDEKGNILSEAVKNNGKSTKTEYAYDEYGNVLTYKKSSENVVYSYTYELHYFPNNTPKIPELPAINR